MDSSSILHTTAARTTTAPQQHKQAPMTLLAEGPGCGTNDPGSNLARTAQAVDEWSHRTEPRLRDCCSLPFDQPLGADARPSSNVRQGSYGDGLRRPVRVRLPPAPPINIAPVVKPENTPSSEGGAERLAGSTPAQGTKQRVRGRTDMRSKNVGETGNAGSPTQAALDAWLQKHL